jgi:excisionase family DNA binding protein
MEITVETYRLSVIRRCGSSVRTWCAECLAEVEMITPNEAARMAGAGSRKIYRWIEARRIHFIEDPGGLILICANSLNAQDRMEAAQIEGIQNQQK